MSFLRPVSLRAQQLWGLHKRTCTCASTTLVVERKARGLPLPSRTRVNCCRFSHPCFTENLPTLSLSHEGHDCAKKKGSCSKNEQHTEAEASLLPQDGAHNKPSFRMRTSSISAVLLKYTPVCRLLHGLIMRHHLKELIPHLRVPVPSPLQATPPQSRGPVVAREEHPGYPCVGCDIVQADHAPEAGVAQGSFMEFSSSTRVDIRKRWKKDLRKK